MTYDYVITKPPLDEDTLTHYGVVGMRWGVRRDLKKYGTISGKTKKKINKALSKASYRKTRRMLNAADQIKADARGNQLFRQTKAKKRNSLKNQAKSAKATMSAKSANSLNKMILDSAKSKGYKYDTREVDRLTDRALNNDLLWGLSGALYNEAKDKRYRKKNKTESSPYMVKGTYYKKSYR